MSALDTVRAIAILISLQCIHEIFVFESRARARAVHVWM
jgi:hypothetical protein